jgi:hypothetical protein
MGLDALASRAGCAILSPMPYRDDRPALEALRDDLQRELDELRPRTEALREMVRTQEAVERELLATEMRLSRLDVRRASLLDDARVASPCNASWDAMTGDEHVRFCDQCQKNVYNLSALPRDEATRLLAEREGSICVRLYRRADGTVITADCPVGVRKKRVRLALFGAAGAGALTAAAAWSATTVVMGKMPMHPPQSVAMGAVPMSPDSYVPQPVHPKGERGPAFFYRQEPQQGRPGVQWKVWPDGRVERTVDGKGSVADVVLEDDARTAVEQILEFSRELRPEATGAVPPYADSAIFRSYELAGPGTREATDDDRARLFGLAERLRGR